MSKLTATRILGVVTALLMAGTTLAGEPRQANGLTKHCPVRDYQGVPMDVDFG